MNSQRTVSRAVRRLAAATFVLFVLAQFVCTGHCALGARPTASKQHGCCEKKAAGHQQDRASGSCLTFKTIASTDVVKFDVSADRVFSFVSYVVFESAAVPALGLQVSSDSRETNHPDCVIAHEVSLGSDARSHAPPFLA